MNHKKRYYEILYNDNDEYIETWYCGDDKKIVLNKLANEIIEYVNFYYEDDYSRGVRTIKGSLKVVK